LYLLPLLDISFDRGHGTRKPVEITTPNYPLQIRKNI
jgi:hypothetical protein